jgi:hypothetical protein
MRLSIGFAALMMLAPASASANLWDGPGGSMPRASERGPVTFVPAVSETRRNVDSAVDALKARRDSGDLTRKEYRELRREARLIARLEERYSFDGLSRGEEAELQFRSRHLLEVARSRSVRR